MDHWEAGSTAFLGTWSRLEKEKLSREVGKSVLTPSAIWCSHEHGDHFDKIYLEKADKKATILCPAFVDKTMLSYYKKNGYKDIAVLNNNEELLIEGVSLRLLFERPFYTCHSSCLLEVAGKKILHNADTTITKEFLSNNDIKNLNVLIAQYTNPSPYPLIVDMDSDTASSIVKEQHESALANFVNYCNWTNAEYAVPCAGPVHITSFEHRFPEDLKGLIYNKKENIRRMQSETKTKILNLNVNDDVFSFTE
jgi:hypothetical protein